MLEVLAQSVANVALTLQVHLLSLLRVVLAVIDIAPISSSPTATTTLPNESDDKQMALLVHTLVMGLTQRPVKNIRYHWLEFIAVSLPHLVSLCTVYVCLF